LLRSYLWNHLHCIHVCTFLRLNDIWSTDTDTGHDTSTDTSIPLIIWKNDIIQCNYKYQCYVGVRHRHVSDIGTRLIREVSVLHGIHIYALERKFKLRIFHLSIFKMCDYCHLTSKYIQIDLLLWKEITTSVSFYIRQFIFQIDWILICYIFDLIIL
jgi:hypothetical protein